MSKFYYYLLIINIISFLIFGLDKYLAISNKQRISEASIISLMIIGGSIGSFIGMFVFHHKTKHPKFYICFLISLILWIYILFGKEVKIWNTH